MTIPFLNLQPMHVQVREQMAQAFNQVYDSNWFVMGEQLKAFERDYAAFSQTGYAVGVSNGLDALTLSLRAYDIGPGDEVLVPSNTYIATVLAISHVGATPVFVEPRWETFNLDPEKMAAAMTKRTKAVIPVHLYGQACEMEAIMAAAEEFGLTVIEDNAQSHGAAFLGKKTGSWGHANATSFYPGKNLGALGDGGAITTDDERVAERVGTLRNYGSRAKYYNEEIGYNNRLDELQAAFLNVKLSFIDRWTKERQEVARLYDKALAGCRDLILPQVHPDATHVYHLYVIRSQGRQVLQERLRSRGVGTLVHYPVPPYMQKAYSDLGHRKGEFPIADEMADTVLSLPLWPGMTMEAVSYITDCITN